MQPIVTATQIRAAESRCFSSGTASLDLMERAGKSVADYVQKHFSPRPVAVLCGPGNNGGDGYVVARYLHQAGFDVTVAALCLPEKMRGDAAVMAARWDGPFHLLDQARTQELMSAPLWIDALFGIGMNKPMPDIVRHLSACHKVAQQPSKIIAVDTVSGLVADQAGLAYCQWQADVTLTFAAKKPCHLFNPARSAGGEIYVVDIGLAEFIDTEIYEQTAEDGPFLLKNILTPSHEHKYDRGALYVASGFRHKTGAARLAARAGLRAGAGVVTLLAPPDAMDIIAMHETSIMLEAVETADDLIGHVTKRKESAIVIGPAHGVNERTCQFVEAVLGTKRPVVLDADALTSFTNDTDRLFKLCHGKTILTPHMGEFIKLFPDLASSENPAQAAHIAAQRSGAILVLKGPATVIASPDGPVRINTHASPWLATAGSGDVLAGLIGALQLQYSNSFDAACAGVWLHGACGISGGPGLIAEDLPKYVPSILAQSH